MSVPGDLNGVSAAQQAMLRNELADARRLKDLSGPWSTVVSWDGGFQSVAQIRGHAVSFDESVDLAGDDAAPSPHEYLLSALGACLIAGVVMHATVREIRLRKVELSIAGTFDNILKWAGIEKTGNPGYRALEVRATIDGDAEERVLHDIWESALASSPVAQTLNRPTPVIAVMDVVASEAP